MEMERRKEGGREGEDMGTNNGIRRKVIQKEKKIQS